jgi:HEPN domain-containing protein
MEIGENSREFIKAWLRRAKADFKSAEDLFRNEDFADSTYHSQQAAEKACKALLIAENAFIEEHKISKWFKKVFNKKIDEDRLNEIIKNVMDLEVHWVKPKYPFAGKGYIWDPTKEYTKRIAEEALEKAKFVVSEIEKILKEKYGLSLEEGK